MGIIIFKTVITVLQVLLMLTIWFTCKNKNDRGVCVAIDLYLALVMVALWI